MLKCGFFRCSASQTAHELPRRLAMLAPTTRQVNMLNLAKAALTGLFAMILLAACDHAREEQQSPAA
jgi:hypothetical protein